MGSASFPSEPVKAIVFVSLIYCFSFSLHGCKGCPKEERIALLQLKDSLNYPNGSSLVSGWVGDDCCNWESITCDLFHSTNRVVGIDLSDQRDIGVVEKWYPNASLFTHFKELQSLNLGDKDIGGWIMPEALCELHNLQMLDLRGNSLNDSGLPRCFARGLPYLESIFLQNNSPNLSSHLLSALCGLKNLRVLDLSDNVISNGSFPPCMLGIFSSLESLHLKNFTLEQSSNALTSALQGARNLQDLDLSANNLSDGSLRGLCKLRKLRTLDLTKNLIGNNIWSCLSQLNSLQSISLGLNQISGTIPPFISNLTSLVTLHLHYNKLDGVVFFSMFANLSKLFDIDLSDNRQLEIETEFPTWVPSFQLDSLALGNCILNKRTHRNIPRFLSSQYELRYVSLSGNSLQGVIPSSLFYNATPNYALILRDNLLDGPFPLPLKNETSMLTALDISGNNIEGQLPRNIDVFFPNLIYLNMSENKLEGCIPATFGNINFLMLLDISNNHFDGEVPHSLTQNSTLLTVLILSNNCLHSMARVSNMTRLATLSLDGNHFTRPFPITPSSVPFLLSLDLSRNSMSGYIQDWLPVFPNVLSLLLRGNLFVGYLPTSLCQMQQLRFLDLSNNRISGSIPSCLNNITSWLEEFEVPFSNGSIAVDITIIINFATKGNLYSFEGLPLELMTGIDLSLNQLSGDIPSEMGELKALHSLNLSHNSLTGYFPESFQELKRLESLDLSHNKLVGMIPPQIIELSFLSTFNVAFNQLSGKIPYEKNFATFTKDCYIGNLGLCGPPTDGNCSSPQPTHNEHKEDDDDEQSLFDNNLFFYACEAISYVLGFWVIVGPLLLSRNWRRMYFGVVDRCIDWCDEMLFWFLFYFKNCW